MHGVRPMNFFKTNVSLKSRLERVGLESVQLNTKFLKATWKLGDSDRDAAWELYVEMLTRITTQPLLPEHGDEKTALDNTERLFWCKS